MADPHIERYRTLVEDVEREFRRNRRRHGKRIRCAAGCDECCSHIFSISEIEAGEVSRAVKGLPSEQRKLLEEKAAAYLPARDAVMKRSGYIQARGNLPTPETRLACPALMDGRCAIYEQRPLICRKYGMPLVHPEQPGRVFACELNFSPGESFEDPALVTIQTEMHHRWGELQRDHRAVRGAHEELPISVADAILRDFDGADEG